VLTETTAEIAAALTLAAARRVVEADSFMRNGHYKGWLPTLFVGQLLQVRQGPAAQQPPAAPARTPSSCRRRRRSCAALPPPARLHPASPASQPAQPAQPASQPSQPPARPPLLQNKTVGIVGAGRIGAAYARMMVEGHKMDLVYYDPYPNKKLEQYVADYGKLLQQHGERPVTVRRLETVEEVLQQADVGGAAAAPCGAAVPLGSWPCCTCQVPRALAQLPLPPPPLPLAPVTLCPA
jgi:lactate dehydrogenase-like 2-hydroxyacid dehydrogenase